MSYFRSCIFRSICSSLISSNPSNNRSAKCLLSCLNNSYPSSIGTKKLHSNISRTTKFFTPIETFKLGEFYLNYFILIHAIFRRLDKNTLFSDYASSSEKKFHIYCLNLVYTYLNLTFPNRQLLDKSPDFSL